MHRYLDQSGVRKFQAGILRVMDYAVQARLRAVLEALVRARHLRSRRLAGRSADGSFTTLPLRVTSDPGAALRYAERLMLAAEKYRAEADRRALRELKQQQRAAKKAAANNNSSSNNNNNNGDGDGDESEEFDDDEEESDESDVVISNEDDDESEEEEDDDDDDDDDPDADVDDKTKKRKRNAAAVKRGPGRKGKRAKAGAEAAGGGTEEMTQAEAARRSRLDKLKALEEKERLDKLKAHEDEQRDDANKNSAVSFALGNVGVAKDKVKDKDELQRKLKEREDTRDKLKKRLGDLSFKESERALLLKLRGQKSGQMEPSEVAQLRLLEVRWEAFKKLSEMVSAFAKEIENLNQQLNADPEAERQRLLESEAEHLASRVAEQAAMVGSVPAAPVTASASSGSAAAAAATTAAAVPAASKRRRRAGAKGDDDDDDDDYDEGAGTGGSGEPKIEPTTARTAAKAGLAFVHVEPEPEQSLAQRLATPEYTTPQVTLDDCQMLRNSEIPSHVFDRFEIAQLKRRAAENEQSMK